MSRLCYVLPVLWALGWGQSTNTSTPTTVGTVPLNKTTQVTTIVNTSTAIPSNSAVSPTAATIHAVTTIPTSKIPSASAGNTKPTTTVSSGSQGTTHATTVKADTKTVGVTSELILSTTKTSAPNETSTNDSSTQPTNFRKASTTVLKDNTRIVTLQPSITEKATKLAATSLPFSRTSELGNETTTNYSSTVVWLSTVSSSPVTISNTTTDSTSDSTTSLLKENIPNTTPSVKYNQENIEVNCKAEHGGSLVKINIKPSRICGEDANMNENDAKEILKHICTALKPGYLPNKDKCHIDLSSAVTGHLVIVDAYVQSSLSPDDLYASLKHIKKDSSYLFQYDQSKYEEEDLVSIPLISAIVSLAVALLIIAAIYGCWHQRQTRKREQRLTEELQTMENGYHDNPTLEVMETSPEMQEKKGGPNGELGDSWIVPLDNLTREDLDEEDTHL